ncbi:hypothetical protein HZB06_01240 [Candidatus Wolfebacteria bacterium]|nr:hypothetical protein [Candidatus Wolfebacteria bacterium]
MQKIIDYAKNNKLGVLTMTLSLTLMLYGLPSQILAIWEIKSAKEISLAMFGIGAIQCFFWVLYGIQKNDWFIITPNSFGALFMTIIVAEYFLFH